MAQVGDLICTGAARFLNTINGNITSADNSAKLQGYTSDTAATAHTIVRRDANKYVYATYYNSSISNEDINSYTNDPAVMFTSNDKWIRRTTKANLQTWLGLGSAAYTASTAYLASTTTYAGSSSVGGAATSLANFSTTTTTTVGTEITTNVHGYVNGLTKASWNNQQVDGALYGQFYSASWKHLLYADYRTGHLATRGKNNGTWQDWLIVYDSGNLTSKAAAASGTDVSLVTTGEKATWNAKVSGSGTSGYLTKWNGSSSITNGPALSSAISSQTQSTKFLREDGTWSAPSYTTNTNTTYTIGTSGNNITLTPSSGSAQSITAPYATSAGSATSATRVCLYTSRQASANLTAGGTVGLSHFLATSSMTTGKPGGDAHILHMMWDNTGGYDAQLAAIHGGQYHLEYRSQDAGTWKDWKTIIDSGGGTITGTLYAKGADIEAWDKNALYKIRLTATNTPRCGLYDVPAATWLVWRDDSNNYHQII